MLSWSAKTSSPLPEQRFQLIAVDLDSTLQTDGTIHEADAAAIRTVHAAGVKVVLVSARPPRAVRKFWGQLGLGAPVIALNGAVVYDFPRQEVLDGQPVDPNKLSAVLRQALSLAPKVLVGFEDAVAWAVSQLGAVADWQFRETGQWPASVGNLRSFRKEHTIYQVWFDGPPEVLQRLEVGLNDTGLAMMHYSKPERLVLRSAAASRGWALSALAAQLEVPMHQVMAIGDGGLDRSLLQAAAFAILTSDLESIRVDQLAEPGTVVKARGLAEGLRQYLMPQLQSRREDAPEGEE